MILTAFIMRDIQTNVSYRLRFVMAWSRMAVMLLLFFYLGKTFSGALSPHLLKYGGDYFPYALVGLAVSTFVTVGLRALSDQIRQAQVHGTLEALLATPTSIYMVLIGNSIWRFLTSFIAAFGILAAGGIFLDLRISGESILGGVLILSLTFVAFLSVGMLSASFIMIFKQGNPINFLFGTSSYFLGGVIFPVEVLPRPFQVVAEVLPMTHAVKALRELLLARMDLADIVPLIIKLIIFIVITVPLSIVFFRYAVKRAKLDGSLVQF